MFVDLVFVLYCIFKPEIIYYYYLPYVRTYVGSAYFQDKDIYISIFLCSNKELV